MDEEFDNYNASLYLQEQEKVIDVNGNEDASQKKGSWTEEDDCYYCLLSQTWNGIKVVSGQNRGEGTDEENIKVVYGKNGIRSLEIIGYCSLKEKEETAVRCRKQRLRRRRSILKTSFQMQR